MTEQEALQTGRAVGAGRNRNPRCRVAAFAAIIASAAAMVARAE